ncbi:MAG: kinase/pyrophosphorylase, partial [Oceanococcaceae bacterium]
YGLICDVDRLHQIRSERRPGSKYASVPQCQFELSQAEALFKRHGIPYLNTSNSSIEEIAAHIMQDKNLRRQTF